MSAVDELRDLNADDRRTTYDLRHVVAGLRRDKLVADVHWQAERLETMQALRALAKTLGIPAAWPEDLHLRDVVERYIGREVEERCR
jgi:hypothetical protein